MSIHLYTHKQQAVLIARDELLYAYSEAVMPGSSGTLAVAEESSLTIASSIDHV